MASLQRGAIVGVNRGMLLCISNVCAPRPPGPSPSVVSQAMGAGREGAEGRLAAETGIEELTYPGPFWEAVQLSG